MAIFNPPIFMFGLNLFSLKFNFVSKIYSNLKQIPVILLCHLKLIFNPFEFKLVKFYQK